MRAGCLPRTTVCEKINNGPTVVPGAFFVFAAIYFVRLFARLQIVVLPLGHQNGKTHLTFKTLPLWPPQQ